jgi:hypothetical protein
LSTPTKEELELINTRFAKTPLTADDVYVWTSAVSNSLPDSYGTAMHPETLDDYLNDIKQGVPRMVGHDVRGKIAAGRTFDGYIVQNEPLANGHPFEVLYAKSYMPRHQQLASDLTTDDVISAIEAGTVFGESIGFADRPGAIPASWECGICGAPMEMDWFWLVPTCNHMPGKWYDDEGNQAPDGEGRFNFTWIRNAQLAEISLVFMGAAQDSNVQRNPKVRTMGLDVPLRVADIAWVRSEAKGDKPGSMDTSTYDNTVTGHRLCHLYWRRWKGGSSLPKNWTEAHLKQEHSKCVRALLEKYNGSHTMRDGLDDTLPQDLKKKSKGGDRMPDEEKKETREPANDAGSIADATELLARLEAPLDPVPVVVAGSTVDPSRAEPLQNEPPKIPPAETAKESVKNEPSETNSLETELRTLLGLSADANIVDAVRALKKDADRGKAAREKAEREALEWGVRAMGNDFPAEVFKKQFAAMPDEELETAVNAFKSQARKLFPDKRLTESKGLSLEPQLSEEEAIEKEAERRIKAAGLPLKKEG